MKKILTRIFRIMEAVFVTAILVVLSPVLLIVLALNRISPRDFITSLRILYEEDPETNEEEEP